MKTLVMIIITGEIFISFFFNSFHFIFFIHGNPVGKGRFSGGRDKNLKSKIYKKNI